ncbi:MAG TPA: YtxH domain-containing protein [Terriglobales bacterium]|nr:YtxH domain-containing protein [Terriglobales bacterium]
MRLRKENILWNILLGTGVYLLDSLRGRLVEGVEELSDRARGTYSEASRRVSRASDVIRGEDHHGISTAAALLIGVGVGVGVGMLLAPASGEETRNTISSKVHEFGDRMRDKMSEQQRREAGSGTYGT